ncbi:tryptophan synthase alpha subunit [Thermobifida halotolerans]|uniref:tryptophan synthase subunit alpha n=1 Tax=Thermobifida halotolerans TaxID=483545 RepID=UPI003511652A
MRCSREAGVDGLVLAGPRGPEEVERVAAADLSAVPLIGPSAADAGRLEAAAGHMTYRGLAARTGERLDLAEARRAVAALAATAGKPFLAGFGIRDEHEIRALAPHAAGLVVGSRLLELLGAAEPRDRLDTLRANVRRWKDATRLRERKREDGCGST